MQVDLIVHGARQLVTCASPDGPKRGVALTDAGVIENGALAVAGGRIAGVGRTEEVRDRFRAVHELDATGKVVCPGFVDCHTHLVFAGDRVAEFEQKLAGASYMEILQAGGGILSTMRATRAASVDQLAAEASLRLRAMMRLGTTTVEIKSGYGLDTATELKLLDAIAALAVGEAVDVVPTFLGAHAIPPEYAGRTDAYVDLVIGEMLPAVADWHARSPFTRHDSPFTIHHSLPFCDIFCEANVFDYTQTARIFAAARALGMPLKLHADEFVSLGGVRLAVEQGAVSVDHLDVTPAVAVARLAASPTVAVLLPAVNFHLGSRHFADARGLIDAGAAAALATDANPGSAPCLSLPFVMAVACRYQKLTPAEALNAVTINAAHALGLGHAVGSLEVGKQGDFLLLDAPDYRHLVYWFGHNQVDQVFKRGMAA
jgi:imidazolonepropionase